MDYQACFPFPQFSLAIRCDAQAITGAEYLPEADEVSPANALAEKARQQIAAYLCNSATTFDLPLSPSGTPFQQKVWREITRIPAGQTITYAELARGVGSGPRAVANACGANPIPLLIPCHRVVASHGLGGFMQGTRHDALNIKRWLLAHEGAL